MPTLPSCGLPARRMLAGLDRNRRIANRQFVAPHDHLNLEWIEFDAATTRPVSSAAIKVEPEPRNGPITMSPW